MKPSFSGFVSTFLCFTVLLSSWYYFLWILGNRWNKIAQWCILHSWSTIIGNFNDQGKMLLFTPLYFNKNPSILIFLSFHVLYSLSFLYWMIHVLQSVFLQQHLPQFEKQWQSLIDYVSMSRYVFYPLLLMPFYWYIFVGSTATPQLYW